MTEADVIKDLLGWLEEVNHEYTETFLATMSRLERLFYLQQKLGTDIIKALMLGQPPGSPYSTKKGGE
jgi:hypothetical protein